MKYEIVVDRLIDLLITSQVFEELLLDADLSVNAGTWLWLSCSSFFQQVLSAQCTRILKQQLEGFYLSGM